ncbi:MAG: hypothetical protein HQ521_16065 [Bacteroidetes bacterium]|nr:hypothetical protein [Bacteroidota bacterium]
MKVTIILASILFIFTSTSIAQAQIEAIGVEDILLKLRLKDDVEGLRNNTYQNIEGNPFMFEDFKKGNIKLKDDEIFEEMVQFDKYAGEIHFKKENDIYAIAFPEKIEYIEMGDVRFIYSLFKLSESKPVNEQGAYFVVLFDNKCKVLAKKNTDLKSAQPSNGIAEAKPAKFIDLNDSYFFKLDSLPAVRINSKKDLTLFFKGKGSGIPEFIKKENIKFKNTEDLKRLAEFYNQQLNQ